MGIHKKINLVRDGDWIKDTRTEKRVAYNMGKPKGSLQKSTNGAGYHFGGSSQQQNIPTKFQAAPTGQLGGEQQRQVDGFATDDPRFFRKRTGAPPDQGPGLPGLSPSDAASMRSGSSGYRSRRSSV
ncbi:hypothetical protein N0V90_001611 [Kalmusia sp. IMI 367209]|nr:hypothetical protein N0V90_001611 [Kalmusia sp. IMI 367209]